MGFLNQLSIMPLLFVAMVFCQHEDYDFEDEYDPEPDEQPSLFHINPSVDYEVSHFSGPLRCVKECFCLTAFPLSMYCDHRKLKMIPAIPIHIQQLYLQYNNIEAVSSQSFANVTILREINLSHNKINSHMIDYGVFAKLGNLVQLHLQHNELEEFPFPLPNSLEQLLLGFNKISRLPANALQGLVNVTMLDLCNNNLDDSDFKGKQLSNMKNLMQINLCNNKLQNMPPDLPSSLMYLSLENNSISYIPENYFNKLPNITALRLSNNNLQEVPYKVFNLSNLVELNLGHNKLKQTFYIPRSLQHLYIEDNDIEIVNITLMCPFIDPVNTNQLTYIRMDQNKLTAPISTYAFFCFPHIRIIYYGEQKGTVSQSTQLRTPVFQRFLTPDEYEEARNEHEVEYEHEEDVVEREEDYIYLH
ncbi:osteomodulin [Alligator mississippiensis]|uniref:osteomodulin n=1 Tax=Alligator mississippiensis TaxID=8496 RepID=UPI0003D0B1C5|nr:osteomodulin [Alligator mississippiensis]